MIRYIYGFGNFTMIFLCDAMNMMYKIPETHESLLQKNLPKARKQFIQVIHFFGQNYKTNKKHFFELFFDGSETEINFNFSVNIKIHYSYDGKKADDEIINFIKKSQNREKLCIISSDNQVKIGAIKAKCHHWFSEDFIKEFSVLDKKLYFSFDKREEKSNNNLEFYTLFQNKKDKKYEDQEKKFQPILVKKVGFSKKKITPSPDRKAELKNIFDDKNKEKVRLKNLDKEKNHRKHTLEIEEKNRPLRKNLSSFSQPDIDPNVFCSPEEVKEYMRCFHNKKR